MSQQSSDRQDALKLLLGALDEWPSKEEPRDPALIFGYHWCKFHPDHEWVLANAQNDTLSHAEFHVAYFEAMLMKDHFDQKFISTCAKMLKQSKGNKKGYEVTLTRAQVRAMCFAISTYDERKAKLAHINEVADRLNKVLTQ